MLTSRVRYHVQVEELRLTFGPVVASIVEDSLWLKELPERTG